MPPMPAKSTISNPADCPPALPIEVAPYSPGLLLMTIPAAIVLTDSQASALVVSIHDALAQLRRLDAEHQTGPKNGKPAGRGIAGGKRKR
jgi:hypothetical protein